MNTLRTCLAETIGTYVLCFVGIGTIVNTAEPIAENSGAQLLAVALAFGFAVMVAVDSFGGISGAHINPAVTIGFLAARRIQLPLAAGYIVSQLVGAVAAAATCKWMFRGATVEGAPDESAVVASNLGMTLPAEWVDTATLLGVEFLLTFLLMTIIYGAAIETTGKPLKVGAFAIGMMVTLMALAAGPITGASMNPARSFGPALMMGDFAHHAAYWVAPIAGAVAAALLFEGVLLTREVTESVTHEESS